MPASIFISHSVREDPPARAFLDAVAAALRADGFDVWFDEARLEGGDNWHVVIANRMVDCHGAVILLTARALARPYVQYEIANLFARWSREQATAGLSPERRMRLLPLVLPGLTVPEVRAHPLLSSINFPLVNFTVPAVPDDAAALVRATFGGIDPWPSPLDELEERVEGLLRSVQGGALLQAAAREALGAPVALGPPAGQHRALARILLRAPGDRLAGALQPLFPLIASEDMRSLYELLAPCWISDELGVAFAARLCTTEPAAGAAADRFAVVGGSHVDFTPEMCLLRARRNVRRVAGRVAVALGPFGRDSEAVFRQRVRVAVADEIVRHLARAARRELQDIVTKLKRFVQASASATALEDAALAEADALLELGIRQLTLARQPLVIACAVDAVDLDMVAAVAGRAPFRSATFLALCNDEVTGAHAARVLYPPLSRDLEDSAHEVCVAVEALLE